jgi:hypothetical protein
LDFARRMWQSGSGSWSRWRAVYLVTVTVTGAGYKVLVSQGVYEKL